jgi:chorismate dehydratase
MTMRIGRIPYINCYPVYGAVDRGAVALDAELVDGVPTALNRMMAEGALDVSVVSAVEYARDWDRYLLLPDLAISCDGPVRSVLLFSDRPAQELTGQRVLVSRSSMTSVYLLELLFEQVWKAKPVFVPGDAEAADVRSQALDDSCAARLVIGDAALMLRADEHAPRGTGPFARASRGRAVVYDLGAEWKAWTGLPFVFAVWVAQRSTPTAGALAAHASLIESRNWGLRHLPELAAQAHTATGVGLDDCTEYLSGLDYGLSYPHLGGLTEFYRKLTVAGKIPPSRIAFLAA